MRIDLYYHIKLIKNTSPIGWKWRVVKNGSATLLHLEEGVKNCKSANQDTNKQLLFSVVPVLMLPPSNVMDQRI